MRLVVFGGYSFNNKNFIYEKLARLKKKRNPSTIIRTQHGSANRMIGDWLRTNAIIDLPVVISDPQKDKTIEQERIEKLIELKPSGFVVFPGGPECDEVYRAAINAGYSVWDLRRL